MTDKLDLSDVFNNPIVLDVWDSKYRLKTPDGASNEHTIEDSLKRVVNGVFALDKNKAAKKRAEAAVLAREFIPAGRIQAGAGTDKAVTLINCYVNEDVDDSMPGIMHALNTTALTMQQGGGVGTDFTTIRPNGAIVRRTGSVSSGILPFMDMWHAMCGTIMSSGSRRGAMMGTLADWHPDVLDFIKAKRTPGRLTNFNVSVLVSDALMQAVKEDKTWYLGFGVPRATGQHVAVLNKHPYIADQEVARKMAGMRKEDGDKFYVYQEISARELWDTIIRSTYDYAEPGVIFVDQINKRNNMYYAEYIHCTNPCGEQPLPPHNVCDLGPVNLAQLVKNPFTPQAEFDFERLKDVAAVAVRFLDNVLDVTIYPLPEQKTEALSKRRLGVGITGLGNALAMLGLRYGSTEAVTMTDNIMQGLALACYRASVELAKERGPFPLFNADKYLAADFVRHLCRHDPELAELIRTHGIRNSHLLSIAPTGTISLYSGNLSGGLEPVFSFRPSKRKVLQPDGSRKEYIVKDFGYNLYEKVHGPTDFEQLPEYMVGALDLSVDDHLVMQATCQKWVDSAISKTINCPAEMSYDDFKAVYMRAYDLGCKGCTTYRPSGIRDSVLEEIKAPTADAPKTEPEFLLDRPETTEGRTYKIKWPGTPHAFYVTINHTVDPQGRIVPFEVFINSKSVEHQEWIVALTRTLSAVFRRGGDVTFLVEELSQVFSPKGGFFVGKAYSPSLVAMIGRTLEQEFIRLGLITRTEPRFAVVDTDGGTAMEFTVEPEKQAIGDLCPACEQYTLIRVEGCVKCTSCGHSSCG